MKKTIATNTINNIIVDNSKNSTIAEITAVLDDVRTLKPDINNINFEDILIDINTRLDDIEIRLKMIEELLGL